MKENKHILSSKLIAIAYILLVVGNCVAYLSIQSVQEIRNYRNLISSNLKENTWYVTDGEENNNSADEDDTSNDDVSDFICNLDYVEVISSVYSQMYSCQEDDQVVFSTYSYDQIMQEILRFDIEEGRLPENDKEIVITSQAGNRFSVGDTVTLYLEEKKSMVSIVGILSGDQILTGLTYNETLPEAKRFRGLFQTVYEKSDDFQRYGAILFSDYPWSTMKKGSAEFWRVKPGVKADEIIADFAKQDLSFMDMYKSGNLFQNYCMAYHQEESFSIWLYLHLAALLLFFIMGFYHIQGNFMWYGLIALCIPWIKWVYEECKVLVGQSINFTFSVRLFLLLMVVDWLIVSLGIGLGRILAGKWKCCDRN